MVVELCDEQGTVVRGLPDPAGGNFDAAGDFDRLLGHNSEALATWALIDSEGEVQMRSDQMDALLGELVAVAGAAKPGRETRGVERLRIMAERCRDDPRLVLRFTGD